MARYINCSRAQREREEEEEEEEAELRRRQRGRSRSASRSPDREQASQTAASSGAGTSRRRQGSGRSPNSRDTRRRRNPARERHRTENIIHHQMHAAEVYVDRFYVIEKLLDRRYDANGNEEYFVRWLNYPPEYDSWEPRAELEKNALDMINEYNRITSPTECSANDLHCICRRPYKFDQGGMIQCLNCNVWYHFTCLNMNMVEANSYAKYYCDGCRKNDSNLKNVIKKEKMSTLIGNTSIVKIESDSGIVLHQ